MLKILCVEILDEYVRSYITLLVMTVQNVLNVLYIEVLSEYHKLINSIVPYVPSLIFFVLGYPSEYY